MASKLKLIFALIHVPRTINWQFFTLIFSVLLQNYVISILALVRWLSEQFERAVYECPSFASASKQDYRCRVVISIFEMVAEESPDLGQMTALMYKPNFNEISEYTADIFIYFRVCKQMVAILKFYFRFRSWPIYCHRHLILRRPTTCHRNRTFMVKLWGHIDFSR